jgi:broad specificity phosphatase PhoE
MLNPASWKCTDVFFIRHAESNNNCLYDIIREKFGDLPANRFEEELEKLHDPDCGISPRGQQQAHQLCEYLQANKLKTYKPGVSTSQKYHILSSPMKRCLLTAQQVSIGLGNLPVTVNPRFFESDGCYCTNHDGTTRGLPGMNAAQVESLFPHFKCLNGMENGWYHLPHKETSEQFSHRTYEIVDYLWHLHDEHHEDAGPVVVVCHGNVIREVISRLINTSALITHCNTGITHIQLWSNNEKHVRLASVQYVNRVDHLLSHPDLILGNDVWDDHWIQEYPQIVNEANSSN